MITIWAPLFEWVPGADHPDTLRPQDKLAMSCLAAGRTAKAIRLFKRTLADCERTLGADHPYTFRSRNNLAMSYRAAGRTAEAIPLLERTLAGQPGRTEAVVEAMNRRGRHLKMVLECLLLQDDEGHHQGVIVAMNVAAEQK